MTTPPPKEPGITAAGIKEKIGQALVDELYRQNPDLLENTTLVRAKASDYAREVDAVLATLPLSIEEMAALARGAKRLVPAELTAAQREALRLATMNRISVKKGGEPLSWEECYRIFLAAAPKGETP